MARTKTTSAIPKSPANEDGGYQGLDRRWHLARDGHEVAVTEMEYSLMRTFEAFGHWQAECLAAVTGKNMSGSDNAILHIVRAKDRPKGIKEIARLMNRDDIPNIQYSIRKLIQAGLIEKNTSANRRKGVTYRITERGYRVTEDFAKLRSRLLMDFTKSVSGLDTRLEEASRTLDLLAGIYEQAARIAATHRRKREDE